VAAHSAGGGLAELRLVFTTGAEVMDQIIRPRNAEATERQGA
jgi:hypothetical protein